MQVFLLCAGPQNQVERLWLSAGEVVVEAEDVEDLHEVPTKLPEFLASMKLLLDNSRAFVIRYMSDLLCFFSRSNG
jgi:hypothetical protein